MEHRRSRQGRTSGVYEELGDGNHIGVDQASSTTSVGISKVASKNGVLERYFVLKRSNWWKRIILKLWNGPEEPIDEGILMHRRWRLLRAIDDFPSLFRSRFPSRTSRLVIFLTYCVIWFLAFFFLLYPTFIKLPYYMNTDGEKEKVITLACHETWHWRGKNSLCGLDAEKCIPFDDEDVIIRCPALCDRNGWTYSAMTVGADRVKYKGYVIGGGRTESQGPNEYTLPYRADSYPCASGIHAGIISPITGGCMRLSMSGAQTNFPSTDGHYGFGFSVNFDSFFPSSYKLKEADGYTYGCNDPRLHVTIVNFFLGLPIFYLYETIIGYWTICIVGYWTLVLAMAPPFQIEPYNRLSINELWSTGFGRLLPLCFVLYVFWHIAIRKLANGSPLAKVLLWYPLFWVGILNNVTFDRLPIDRLTASDLKEQPGSIVGLAIIASIILVCTIIQMRALWKAGILARYIKLYAGLTVLFCVVGNMPGLNLRLHHYIIGILLIPACSTKGFSAYAFQGILVGIFISGIATWGFDSILETNYSILRGEAGILPAPPKFHFDSNFPHQISWNFTNTTSEYENRQNPLDGISLLINDVETYVGHNRTIDLDVLLRKNLQFSQLINTATEIAHGNNQNNTVKLYMRIARGSTKISAYRGDYSSAGILEWPQGIWKGPESDIVRT
ncbi:uncharacterized protein Ecym_3493 [Eremothecium cymbalariae DBVPG|uniref:LCCL domain-containing protein n=1 Tax=Eremothecium cymbalariae (strain CBS 270.75 / DBVPG 7215 / KCTC 17166 / NRRL Y-17582) TaxID=931890 RepID=G8JS55_ERECY|nr:Hypothetical protein Ecym_3493 [Eremothecium cymbalariae DBVPG\